MSLKKVSKEQPDKFEFSKENLILAEKIIQKYPKDTIGDLSIENNKNLIHSHQLSN